MSLNCATIEDEDGGTGTGAATKGGILFIVVNNSASLKQLNRNRIDESEGSTYLRVPNFGVEVDRPKTEDRSKPDFRSNGESTSKLTFTDDSCM